MKRIINVEWSAFIEKKISCLFRIMNKCLKIKLIFIYIFLLASCSVQNAINKDDFRTIPKNFSASFLDKLDTIGTYDNKVHTRSFIKEFTNTELINYSVPIKIEIKETAIYFTFENVEKKQFVLKFYGKKYRNRFVFYKNYRTISFPFILTVKEMEKYKVYLTASNEILFENCNENTGMLLFFGAGNSNRINYQFKLLRNE